MDLFSALAASAIHRAQKSIEWVDEGSFGRKVTKRYTVFVAFLTSAEAVKLAGSSYADDDYYKVDFTGDVAPQIRQTYEDRRDERLSPAAQAILDASMRRLLQHPMGYSGMRESFFEWDIEVGDGWTPL